MTATIPTSIPTPIPALSSQYDPTQCEAKWQAFWEEAQVFKADPTLPGETYSVVIPPPNVTGSLHMGHALEVSLIDSLVRYHRMTGKNTLCLPGTDHASIAVQTILEKQLQAEGKTREDLGREEFLRRAWEWKAESGGTIVNQMRRLGFSVDWTRERFTLDEGLSKSVLAAFVKLYEEGLIYRGKYLVNWCPASQSAIADLEVENREVDGKLWHFRYPFTEGEGFLEVATTRPETMLGDTGVAVNPNDDRYKHLIGKMLRLPLVGREIPIVADDHVDPAFGTGCVKITPAHDPNDFEMGVRHSLGFINILNKDGSINENGGDFQGQDRFEARKNVVAALEAAGNLVKIEDYKHTVPYSDRGKVPVEPLLSTQWFVKVDPLAKKALSDLDNQNSPEFVPARWSKVYRDWLTNLRDWCISRQLWWGHQIPAWYVVSETDGKIADNTPFIVAENEGTAWAKAREQYGPSIQLEQDPDVLDTWFSSGLWPFSTLGWPEETADFDRYYPTTTLVTGFDIIFFWVARMSMMAGHFTEQMPFKNVYIHGLVRDENGKKMSKSSNNGVDPLVLIDQYGTDALRYTLIKEVSGAGQDISLRLSRQFYELKLVQRLITSTPTADLLTVLQAHLKALRSSQKGGPELLKVLQTDLKAQAAKPIDPTAFRTKLKQNLDDLEKALAEREPMSESVEASRNFTNKLWNASRFVLMNLNGQTPAQLGRPDKAKLELADRWILSRFHQVSQTMAQQIEQHALGEAARTIYEFIWGDFCDWYIELVKSRLQGDDPDSRHIAQQTLAQVLEGILRLLHPFMPHITEEIWHTLTQQPAEAKISLALQLYPQADAEQVDSRLEQNFALLIGTIRTIRNLRAEAGIKPGERIEAILQTEDDREHGILTEGWFYIKDLAKVKHLSIVQPNGGQSVTETIIPVPMYPARAGNGSSDGASDWSNMTWLERLQVGEIMQVVGDFFADYQRPLLTLAAIGAGVFTLQILHAVLDTVDHVPLLTGVLELIGLGYGVWYGKTNLWRSGDRANVWRQITQLKQEIVGTPKALLESPTSPTSIVADQSNNPQNNQMFAGVIGTVQVLIPLAGLVDVAALRAKLEKDMAKVQAEVQASESRLNNPSFVGKAPDAVVQAVRDSLAEAQKQSQLLQARLDRL
jgi:valyl-tRNA synthetase